jgi:membrane protein DedA with SNARE-associated domain
MDTADADAAGEEVTAKPHRPWWAPLTIVAFVPLLVTARIADGAWARWVETNPVRLIAFNGRQRYLALTVANGIDVLPYVVVGTLRIAVVFVVCHLAGRAYREDLLRIFTRYLGLTPEAIDSFDRGLDKAEVVIIPFFVGSNIVAVLTGIRRTHPLKLAILLAIGIAGRLALIWWLANVFEEPLEDFLRFVQRFQWWLVIASVAAVVLINVRNYRRGSTQ